ncbi:keratin, type I cytoskeletal 15 [Cherax quadricarinatus]|uniref:keratin, type I cytoskeletal 15 n=1 Tax=Cherax quadricarinatus TaxID=27406 RepID=UPI00237A0231|nr:keratin, type II cytoskeletal 1-like [Cherax quadricarinatus]
MRSLVLVVLMAAALVSARPQFDFPRPEENFGGFSQFSESEAAAGFEEVRSENFNQGFGGFDQGFGGGFGQGGFDQGFGGGFGQGGFGAVI